MAETFTSDVFDAIDSPVKGQYTDLLSEEAHAIADSVEKVPNALDSGEWHVSEDMALPGSNSLLKHQQQDTEKNTLCMHHQGISH